MQYFPASSRALLCCVQLFIGLGLSALSSAHAQTVVFDDTFGGGSTINSNPTSPAAPTISASAYQQIAAKPFNPNPPTVSAGHLITGISATSSGSSQIQALFTQFPVALANDADYIELTITFTNQAGIGAGTTANNTLFLGLFNASQVAPYAGGQANSVAALSGGAQGWTGYASRVFIANSGSGSHGIFTRSAQGLVNNNQDVLYNYSGATQVGSGAASTLGALTVGAQYTFVYRITKTGATALQISSTLYSGAGTGGTQLFNQVVASTSIHTGTFDAFALGYRTTASMVSNLDVNAVKVTTNAATTIVPVFTTQPISQTKAVGESLMLSAAAVGGGASPVTYQWKKDGVDIPSATTDSLSFASVALSDAGDYTVVATTPAGSTTSSVATLSVSIGAVAPAILTQPQNAALAVGASHALTVDANGTAPLTYLWEKSSDGVSFSAVGTDSSQYAIASAQASDAGRYRVTVTNAQGTITSTVANVVIAPVITTAPAAALIASGAAHTVSVVAEVGAGAPEPTVYVWKRDDITVTDGSGISGAITSSLQIAAFSAAQSGYYTVTASNSAGAVTSAKVYIGVETSQPPTLLPANNATNIAIDQQLRLVFASAPKLGLTGMLKIHDAATDAVVATIDVSQFVSYAPGNSSAKIPNAAIRNLPGSSNGSGASSNYYYTPIAIYGNEAWVTLSPTQRLAYNKTYYITVTPALFLDATNAAFAGISNSTTWRFSTKAAGPQTPTTSTGPTTITVGLDGSGDFASLQGAFDWIPQLNTLPRTIEVLPGIYRDSATLAQNRNFVTILGKGAQRTDVQIIYPYAYFAPPANIFTAGTLRVESADVTVRNLTIDNLIYSPYSPTGWAADTNAALNGATNTIATTGKRLVFDNVLVKGGQDTIYATSGISYYYKSEVWGSVDFIYGAGLAVFDRCDIVQIRTTGGPVCAPSTDAAQPYGEVFLNCRFPRALVANGYPYDVNVSSTTFMRPWRQDGATAIINCELDTHFSTKGWGEWDGRETTCRAREYGSTMPGGASATTPAARRTAGAYWVNTVDPDYTNTTMSPTDPLLVSPGGIGNRVEVTVNPADYTLQAIFGHPYFAADLTGWMPSVAPSGAPAITTQPASQTVAAGQPVTFTVVATGTPPPTFQWFKNGTAIAGATADSHTIASVALSDAADYTVVVTNSNGTATSNAATLTVHVAPTITTQPLGKSVQTGEAVSFTVAGSGTPVPTYQWFKDNVAIPSATSENYTIVSAVAGDSGAYTVVLTNAAGSATSAVATLSVSATVAPTVISTQPVSQAVTEGQIVTIAVAAQGASLTYQWRKNGADISGATSASLVLSGVTAGDAGSYTVVVTGLGGAVTSDAATLTVTERTVKTVFADVFAAGSTVNSTTPADPTEASTAYQILSDKAYNPTPSLTATGLRFGIANTSSGNVEAQALFSPAPVILSGVGDYLELAATITNVRGMFSATNNTLFVGLYDSNHDAPVAGGLNGTMLGSGATAFTHPTGYVQKWTGYLSRTIYSGGSHQITTRVPQTGNNNQNQSLASVAYRNPTGANVGTAQLSTLTGFVEGAQYTTVLRITRSASSEYTIESRLYEGVGTAGTVLVTHTSVATGATFLTDNSDNLGFDGFAIGARVAGTGQTVEINAVSITTNASLVPVPKITTQPQSVTAGLGQPAALSVVAEGTGLTYQWYKNDVAISGAMSSTYSVASVAAADQGQYKVVVANDLGGRSTSARVDIIVDLAAGTPPPDGFASGVTGGGNRAAVTVTTAAALKTQVELAEPAVITVSGTLNLASVNGSIKLKSNKTIQGIDANATIIGNINIGEGIENVIIRGLNITNPGTTLGSDGRYTNGGDGISIDGGKRVFITHCTLFDCADGMIDTRLGADLVTISWCEFYYTAAQLDHRFTMIADGFLERDPVTDEVISAGAPLRITMHHNWWSDRCDQRMPSSTNGHVHLYNNYWNTPGNSYAALARDETEFLSEHNAYDGVKTPLSRSDNNALLGDGLIRAIGNLYTNTTGTAPDAGTDTVFTPDYSYQMLTAADVAGVIVPGAGNTAGAASASLASGSATLTGPTGVVPVNTSFTLSATVTGFTPVAYQWRKANQLVAGATSATFTVGAMKVTDEGDYTLAMTNAAGDTLVSAPHAIVYSSALVPTIVTQPVNQTVDAGAAANFTVVAEGDAPLSYQWQKSLNGVFTNVTGATSSSFGFSNAQPVHVGQYRVIVTNAVASATSATVTLTVHSSSAGGSSDAGNSGDGGGGGAPSAWFLGALAVLAALRRLTRRE